jgi:hypothetical protein
MRELSVAEQRYEAVRAVIADSETVTEVAARFGVARKTVHAWLAGSIARCARSSAPIGCTRRWPQPGRAGRMGRELQHPPAAPRVGHGHPGAQRFCREDLSQVAQLRPSSTGPGRPGADRPERYWVARRASAVGRRVRELAAGRLGQSRGRSIDRRVGHRPSPAVLRRSPTTTHPTAQQQGRSARNEHRSPAFVLP